ncbi:MAG: alpha/beta hydrolase [Acidimicrobiales bacterium]
MSDPTAHDPDAPSQTDILPGAEPLSAPGGPIGALVVHGFTGTPQSMRPLADALADAGYTVEMPLLPGHGTAVEDMLPTRFADWSAAAEASYADLAERCERVVVVGLSMGGTLTLWLATRHDDIAGIVLVNPACPPPGSSAEMIAGLESLVDAGEMTIDAIGSDIADPDQSELAYGQTPLAPLVDLLRNADELGGQLDRVRCPVLLCTSPQDHVVDPANGDHVAASVAGEVERVGLDRSYHVATLDHDRDLIVERMLDFVARVTAD